MNRIQIDMFEVQLGAALLLQFRRGKSGIIRVLADAGIHAAGYPEDHVHRKLPEAFAAFDGGGGPGRVDLMIGTHYDADHLVGLVPIAGDESRAIGEAWLPPVANDTQAPPPGGPPAAPPLLAKQFEQADGEKTLRTYLGIKADHCRQLRALALGAGTRPALPAAPAEVDVDRAPLSELAQHFARHREAAMALLQQEGEPDADDFIAVPSARLSATALSRLQARADLAASPAPPLASDGAPAPDRSPNQRAGLAVIHKAAADDAINATALFRLVQALKNRPTPVPIFCQTIPDGCPRSFIWNAQQRRFLPRAKPPVRSTPQLCLLGPSEGLVRKHWQRLPVGTYAALALRAAVPVKEITPSNQLSYVACLTSAQQRLLVAGDAGCVDFKPSPGAGFYPSLLAALRPLAVVQVAHHAGRNADFYNALLAAGYPTQTTPSYLLLSHATHDATRPSPEFGQFIAQARVPGGNKHLLFTSQPDATKVAAYRDLACPVVEPPPNDRGDVRLVRTRTAWTVLRHAVQL